MSRRHLAQPTAFLQVPATGSSLFGGPQASCLIGDISDSHPARISNSSILSQIR